MLCNSCNAHFDEEGARNSHYRSEWHRYNLKRKVAGLPGVTEDWFESRKAAAASALAAESGGSKPTDARLECSVCNKQYGTRSAYDNHLRSRGHAARAAVSPSGAGSCEPVLRRRKERQSENGSEVGESSSMEASRKAASATIAQRKGKAATESGGEQEEVEEESEDDEEDEQWEEVEDDEEAALLLEEEERTGRVNLSVENAQDRSGSGGGGGKVEEEEWDWDCSRCLFCERDFKGSVEECVGHMHKAHGFFLPDAEYITDLPGLLSYLALKINKGCLCLFCDERGKSFPTAEAARAHMEAKCHAKLRYGDGSSAAEQELEEFYDFSSSYDEEGKDMQMVLAGADGQPHLSLQRGGAELVIRGQGEEGGTTRVVGSREYALYYKQRPRPSDDRNKLLSVVVSRYKAMGLTTRGLRSFASKEELAKRDAAVKASRRAEQFKTRIGISNNVIRNLPKNVPY